MYTIRTTQWTILMNTQSDNEVNLSKPACTQGQLNKQSQWTHNRITKVPSIGQIPYHYTRYTAQMDCLEKNGHCVNDSSLIQHIVTKWHL